MTATPEKVERLAAAIRRVDGNHDLGAAALAEALLETGEVDVTVPEQPDPDPWPVPGSVAIATVRGDGAVTGVLVMRTEVVGPDDTEQWVSAVPVDGMFWHELDDVTVTSRAVVVTEVDREELLAAVAGLTPHGVLSAIRQWFAAKLEGGA